MSEKRVADPHMAMPLFELPPDMMGSLIQLVCYFLDKYEDGDLKIRVEDLEPIITKLDDEDKIPCVIALGDEDNQIIRFKFVDRDDDFYQIVMPGEPDVH